MPLSFGQKQTLLAVLAQFPDGASLRQLVDATAADESLRTMLRHVSQLVDEGQVEQIGAGPSVRYRRRPFPVVPPPAPVVSPTTAPNTSHASELARAPDVVATPVPTALRVPPPGMPADAPLLVPAVAFDGGSASHPAIAPSHDQHPAPVRDPDVPPPPSASSSSSYPPTALMQAQDAVPAVTPASVAPSHDVRVSSGSPSVAERFLPTRLVTAQRLVFAVIFGMALLYLARGVLPSRWTWTPAILLSGLGLVLVWAYFGYVDRASGRSRTHPLVLSIAVLGFALGSVLAAYITLGLLSLLLTLVSMHL